VSVPIGEKSRITSVALKMTDFGWCRKRQQRSYKDVVSREQRVMGRKSV
jgi:hypothetical protein